MSTLVSRLFLSTLVFAFLMGAQAQKRVLFPHDHAATWIQHSKESEDLLEFARHLQEYLNGSPENFNLHYFATNEAEAFVANIKSSGYLQEDAMLANEIIESNQLVRHKLQLLLGDFDTVTLESFEKRTGFVPRVYGYLVKMLLGDEDGFSECLSMILTRHKSDLKIISLNVEIR